MCSHFVTDRFLGQLRPDLPATATVCQKDASFVSVLKTDKLHTPEALAALLTSEGAQLQSKTQQDTEQHCRSRGERADPGIAVRAGALRHCPDEDEATGEQNH